MRRNTVRALTAVFVAIVLSACCATEGCPWHTVDRKSLDTFAGTDTYTAELCMDGKCYTREITSDSSLATVGFGRPGDIWPADKNAGPIVLTVTTSDRTLTAEGANIEFDTKRPNGRACSPTCQVAMLTIVDGTIVNA